MRKAIIISCLLSVFVSITSITFVTESILFLLLLRLGTADCFDLIFGQVGNIIGAIVQTWLIHRIQPPLILKWMKRKFIIPKFISQQADSKNRKKKNSYQIDDEHNVITEACNAMCGRHSDDKCENIINKRIERFVHERTPRQRSHRFHFVINKQLRQHEEESKCIHTVHQWIQCPRIPAKYWRIDVCVCEYRQKFRRESVVVTHLLCGW